MNTHLWLAQKLAEKAQLTVDKGEKVIHETEIVIRDTELELREMKERRKPISARIDLSSEPMGPQATIEGAPS